jgi:hypothetical protein
MSMLLADLNNVDKAIARGDVVAPEVWAGLDRVLVGMPFAAPKQPVLDTRLSTIKTDASNGADKQRDVADVVKTIDAELPTVTANTANDEPSVRLVLVPDVILAHDTAARVSTDNGGAGYGRADDKMEWLSAYAANAADDPTSAFAPDVASVLVANGPVATLTPSAESIERLLSTYSWQKQLAWDWIKPNYARIESEKLSGRKLADAINADHDKKKKISHETARVVLKDYRWLFYGI